MLLDFSSKVGRLKMKRHGPSTEPCGTEHMTSTVDDMQSVKMTQ